MVHRLIAQRFVVLAALLVVLLVLERGFGFRRDGAGVRRKFTNVLLGFGSALLARVLLPNGVVAVTAFAVTHHLGLLNHVAWTPATEAFLAIIAFDLGLYLQHRAFHRIPSLWRVHRVHHSDPQFDATLGLRFHPAEILISALYKIVLVILVGPTGTAVAGYEILLASFSLMTHANLQLPRRWERPVALFLVTPAWHRLHHSDLRVYTDCHFGNFLSVWDRLLRTSPSSRELDQQTMRIGLVETRPAPTASLGYLLTLPFVSVTVRNDQARREPSE